MTTLIMPTPTKVSTMFSKCQVHDKVTDYYNIAGPDYESWSPGFNMHFGYCKHFTDMFFLEKMLFRMNDEVLSRLQLPVDKNLHIADLGCGVGAVARYAVKKYPNVRITGSTISDYQVEKARSMNLKEGLNNQVRAIKDNFEESAMPASSFDFAYALESACHARGSNKELFIAEMARTLKAGGRFCIADGFIKHSKPLPWLFKKINRKITDCWALPCFGNLEEFKAALLKYGFKDIKTEEISMRIAPSVAYVPWTCIKFFVKELWTTKSLRMKKERWNNVIAPVLGMVLGLYRRHFGYYIISGRK